MSKRKERIAANEKQAAVAAALEKARQEAEAKLAEALQKATQEKETAVAQAVNKALEEAAREQREKPADSEPEADTPQPTEEES